MVYESCGAAFYQASVQLSRPYFNDEPLSAEAFIPISAENVFSESGNTTAVRQKVRDTPVEGFAT